ncbi:MAG: hypothetical protein NT166_00220 [Candidatus Aminicenantes bacterium]|nr:hypothetical protein [Candidatus Aminicenantes bacterium]
MSILGKYSEALKIATEALKKLKAIDCDNKKKADEIYDYIKKNNPSFAKEMPLSNFRGYLSAFIRDDNSEIVKESGRNGYYLKIAEEDFSEEKKPKACIEKKLYPILEQWLQHKGYKTKDTSNIKIMKKWGNPDITGIKIEQYLQNTEIEILTIEVKPTIDNFHQLFFEAVSHRRWANRVYFAFASPLSEILQKDNEELRYFSELFHVGIVVISMEDDIYKKFLKGQIDLYEESSKSNSEISYDIYEISSTLYESKQLKWQKQFLEALGIETPVDVGKWGSQID